MNSTEYRITSYTMTTINDDMIAKWSNLTLKEWRALTTREQDKLLTDYAEDRISGKLIYKVDREDISSV